MKEKIKLGISFDWDFFTRTTRGVSGIEEPVGQIKFWTEGKKKHFVQEPWKPVYDVLHSSVSSVGVLQVADSHRYALDAFEGVTHLIHIDAHHDLGYPDKERQVNCGNWLRILMKRDQNLNLCIVYPSWKGFYELLDGTCPYKKEDYFRRISFFTWDSFQLYWKLFTDAYAVFLERMFIARSSAWAPPWADEEFLKFVKAWSDKPEYVGDEIHAMIPRKAPNEKGKKR